MKQVERLDVEKIKRRTSNVYEAVIIAAKRSRQLNEERIAKLELMPEDDSIEIDTRKVTKVALDELASGAIKLERK
jgi:DNA-directed RNA polymerase omega subunit